MSLSPLQPRQLNRPLGLILFLAASHIIPAITLSTAAADVPTTARPLSCAVAGDTLRCNTADQGLALDFSIDITSRQGSQTGFSTFEQRTPGNFSIKTVPICDALAIVTSNESGKTHLTAESRCSEPVQICMVAQVSGAGAALRPGIAYIEGKSTTLGIQSDDRASTDIDVSGKRIRFCTDPTHLNTPGLSLSLFSGDADSVRTAFQSIPANIKGADGEIVGLTKNGPAVKDGYIFVDLTENNAARLLPIIKRSGFPYVLIYSSTWASSLGSYAFNKKNYPNGLAGLQQVVRSANALGIKVGLHTLTSFIGKNDPLVPQVARSGLLKDDQSSLYADIDATTNRIVAADSLATFPTTPAFYGNAKAGLDILIDDEIMSCPTLEKTSHGVFNACRRGLYGTQAKPHRAGATIYHLAERYGSYLTDLRTPLKTQIAKRLGEVINDAGIDMLYFDGGEVGTANGDAGWFVAEQQIEILKQVRRPLLIEGSGVVPRLWPYLTRIVDDDFASLATIDFLDKHKIAEVQPQRKNILMPDNLGWLGLLKETPAYPATTPEEIATYVARSLALDTPLGIETSTDSLDNNPYTGQILNTLAFGTAKLKSNTIPDSTRQQLAKGTWYYDARPAQGLRPLRVIVNPAFDGSEQQSPAATATATEQGLTLRIRNIRRTDGQAPENAVLTDLDPKALDSLREPGKIDDRNRGLPAGTIILQHSGADADVSSFVDFSPRATNRAAIDLSARRVMQVDFDYSPNGRSSADAGCSVINLQLQDGRAQYRDYFLKLSAGDNQRAILDYEQGAASILGELKPAPGNYGVKPALYGFDFAHVAKLNARWMRACSEGAALRIKHITMLAEQPATISNIALKVEGRSYPIADTLNTGETLDVLPNGTLARCKGAICQTSQIAWPSGKAIAGKSIKVTTNGTGAADVSIGLLGSAVLLQ